MTFVSAVRDVFADKSHRGATMVRCIGALLFFLVFLRVWVGNYNSLECSGNRPKDDGVDVGGADDGTKSPCSGLGVLMKMFRGYVETIGTALVIAVSFLLFDTIVVSTLIKSIYPTIFKPPFEISLGVRAACIWLTDSRVRMALLSSALATACFAIFTNTWVETRGGDATERMAAARAIYAFQLFSTVAGLAWACA